MIPTVITIQRGNEIVRQIEGLQAELASLFGGNGTPATRRRGRPRGSGKASATTNGATVKRARRMSASGRARIVAATKARWAKFHAEQGKQGSNAKPARKGGISATGRAAIAAAQKARWAKIRAEKKRADKS